MVYVAAEADMLAKLHYKGPYERDSELGCSAGVLGSVANPMV